MKIKRPICILCVDDHPIELEGLAAVISTQLGMSVLAKAAGCQAAVQMYREHKPDVVVMNLRMPGVGVEAAAYIRKELPSARIIVRTTYERDEDIYRAPGRRACLSPERHGAEGIAAKPGNTKN